MIFFHLKIKKNFLKIILKTYDLVIHTLHLLFYFHMLKENNNLCMINDFKSSSLENASFLSRWKYLSLKFSLEKS